MTFAMGGAPAPGSDRIPVELFQILKDDAVESAALNLQYAFNMQYAGSWHLQLQSAVILEPQKENLPLFPFFPLLFAIRWWDQMPWS